MEKQLFRIIAGQIPFNGKVSINNVSLNKTPVAYREMIIYAEAEPQYTVFTTGDELLNYHLDVRKSDKKIAQKIVAMFKMSDFMTINIARHSITNIHSIRTNCNLNTDQ